MIEMAAEGRTQREIAEETGRTLVTVNKTIQKAARQIAEYQAAEYWEILGKYHTRLEALAERACDEYLGAPIGEADPRHAAVAIAAVREDAKLLRLSEFAEKSQKAAAEPQRPRIIKIRKSFRVADDHNPEPIEGVTTA